VSEAAPETVDIAGAAAMLDDASPAEALDREPEPSPNVEKDEPADEPDADVESGTEPQAAIADDAPEFWSADDKAAWQDVPKGLRPTLLKYEQQRIAFVNEKTREAAHVREDALRAAQGAVDAVEQAAAWWQQNGPAFQQAFTDKWSQVDLNKLAAENPAEWARLRQQRDHEATLLLEANRRGEAEVAVAKERAERALFDARQVEHAKLAKKLPQYFGPDVAARTYDDLGNFLSSKGISGDRINAIHEAPIIELALAAMRFEQAQKQASTVRAASSNGAVTETDTAKTTPTRVVPGPAPNALGRAGNRQSEVARQVGERFRKSGGASIADAAELIRLNDL